MNISSYRNRKDKPPEVGDIVTNGTTSDNRLRFSVVEIKETKSYSGNEVYKLVIKCLFTSKSEGFIIGYNYVGFAKYMNILSVEQIHMFLEVVWWQ